MIDKQWLALDGRFTNIEFGEFRTMPNHFHAALLITAPPLRISLADVIVRAPLVAAPDLGAPDLGAPDLGAPDECKQDLANQERGQAQGQPLQGCVPLGDIIGAFKSITTVVYIEGVKNSGWPRFDRKLWHRNFHDHIIRSEDAFMKISEYIRTNPARWKDDTYFR
jgi:putative transposase